LTKPAPQADATHILAAVPKHSIARVRAEDLGELLPLMRAYCDFYESSPSDDALRALSHALIADAEGEGLQLLARDAGGRAVGFATVYWMWSTTDAARIGVMNDLFVVADTRGTGLAERLIAACHEECIRRGARRLSWQTAPGNLRAQAVYDRVGATREQWVDYWLDAGPSEA
jgi:GNAT superfamily N-acetyltransferase